MRNRGITLPAVDFGEGMRGAEITFSRSSNTSLAYIGADGECIGVCALSGKSASDTAKCEIALTAGIHKVEITVDGSAVITGASFTPESPFERCEYTPAPEVQSVGSDTWEAVDMLGRRVLSVEDVGGKRDKKVGIFYWTWREAHAHRRPVNVTRILSQYPGAEYRADHPAWGGDDRQCHWNEPLYGYYRNSDPYIIRKHAVLLGAAGVDFIMFDCTNGALLWRDGYEPLLRGLYEAKCDGINVPKIAFMMNFCPSPDTEKMLRAVYQDLYKPGRYSDLWFRIDGKPVVMAYPESLPGTGSCDLDTRLLDEIRTFFTFRPGQPLYGRQSGGPHRPDHWSWLEISPQSKYGQRADGSCEMMSVGVGQNCNDEHICTHFNDRATYGRSYTRRHGHKLLEGESYKYGYNVQEQWDRVIDISPDIAFVTGWNEWIMGQYHEPWLKDNDSTQLAMVDQFDREHSRDIEPDCDGYLDTYYLQLVSNIRRFKGAEQRQRVSEMKTVDIDKGAEQWDDVTPYYRSFRGAAINRDWDGFGSFHYKNDTARNDITGAKVCRDAEYLYFYAECSDVISKPSDEGWMTLFINSDRDASTGWEGYDIAVNRTAPRDGRGCVEAYAPTAEKNSFTWREISRCDVRVSGRTIVLRVRREDIAMSGTLSFEFKWSDNMQQHNALDFYVNGSAAPIGRFSFLFKE